jgi:hypothetical protein
MKLVWLQFLAVLVVVFLGSGATTLSFFFDTEGVAGNVFGATLLDQEVAGQPLDGLLCSTDETVSTMLYSGNAGGHAFSYALGIENAVGAVCGELLVELTAGSSTVYTGSLLGLMSDDRELPGGSTEELLLTLRFAPGASQSGMCQFDTVWLATQTGTNTPGFSDTETITHVVSGSGTGTGAGCVPPAPTVDFYIRKDISGDAQGYALSDFVYRIVGNGIDVVAPHDSFTPLPVGTYTIEELVPEGFVKEDWRIGWYGQCEKGSEFTSTLVVEERHVERFGTLYCTADNQYRPQKRQAEDTAQEDEGLTEETERTAAPRTPPERRPEDRRGGRETTADMRENRRGGSSGSDTQPTPEPTPAVLGDTASGSEESIEETAPEPEPTETEEAPPAVTAEQDESTPPPVATNVTALEANEPHEQEEQEEPEEAAEADDDAVEVENVDTTSIETETATGLGLP